MSVIAPSHTNGASGSEDPEITDLYEEIERLAPRIRGELQRLDAHRDELHRQHQERLAVLSSRRRKLLSMAKALGLEEVTPAAKTTKKASKKSSVSGPVLVKVTEAALSQSEERFTIENIHQEAWGWTRGTTYNAMTRLREMTFLGKVAHDPGRGNQLIYRVLNKDVGLALLAESKAEQHA